MWLVGYTEDGRLLKDVTSIYFSQNYSTYRRKCL